MRARAALRRPGPPHRPHGPHRQARHHLRPAGGGEGPHRRRAWPIGTPAAVRGRRTPRSTTSSTDRPRITFRHEGRDAARCIATSSPAATASTASAATRSRTASLRVYERVYPFAWLGILAERAAGLARADLCPARARLRARHHAHEHPDPPLPAVPAGRGHCRWPTTGSGRRCTRAWAARGRPDPAEGHHPHAQLRRRADAPWPSARTSALTTFGADSMRTRNRSKSSALSSTGPPSRVTQRLATSSVRSANR